MTPLIEVKPRNYRQAALEMAIGTYGNMFSSIDLVDVAKTFEEYLKGPEQNAPQS